MEIPLGTFLFVERLESFLIFSQDESPSLQLSNFTSQRFPSGVWWMFVFPVWKSVVVLWSISWVKKDVACRGDFHSILIKLLRTVPIVDGA